MERNASALSRNDEENQGGPSTFRQKLPEQGGGDGAQRPGNCAQNDPYDDVGPALAAAIRDRSGRAIRSKAATPKKPSRHYASCVMDHPAPFLHAGPREAGAATGFAPGGVEAHRFDSLLKKTLESVFVVVFKVLSMLCVCSQIRIPCLCFNSCTL